MITTVGRDSTTFSSAFDEFDTDRGGIVRQIGREVKRDPLLSEPVERHDWMWVLNAMTKGGEDMTLRARLPIVDTVSLLDIYTFVIRLISYEFCSNQRGY